MRDGLGGARDEALPVLYKLRNHDERDLIAEWWERHFYDPRLDDYRPVLVHSDATEDNVLVDDEATRVLGVIDFEHLSVHDPARDFVPYRYLGIEVQREVMERYQRLGGAIDSDIEYRADRYWELNAFYDVFRAVSLADDAGIQRAIRNLRVHGVLSSKGEAK